MFTYRSIDARQFGLIVRRIDRSALPPIVSKTIAIPGRSGAYYQGKQYGPRLIKIAFTLLSKTRAQLDQKLRDLAAWVEPRGVAPLEFHSEPGRVYYAVLDGNLDIERILATGEGELQFLCPNPFAYALAERSQAITGAGTVTLLCTAPVSPRVVAQFAATAAEFVIEYSGKYVRTVRAFAIGDTLEIDFATGKVTVNGQLAMTGLDIGSDFFELQPGANALTVSVPTIIYYVDKWL